MTTICFRIGQAAAAALLLSVATGTAARADDVVGFTLIDAALDVAIGPLVDGQTIDLAALSTSQISVRAEPSPDPTGSVVFDLDGNTGFRTESAAPYALFGDSGGDYAPWSGVTLLGAHSLSATAYTGSGGTGTPGTPLAIGFEVIDSGGGSGDSFWEVRADSPTPHYEAQGAAVGERLYVFGGFFTNVGGPTVTADSYAYDRGSDAWTSLTDMPEALTHSPQARDGDSIYLVGGYVGDHPGGSTDHVWVYDTVTDTWTAGTPLPADRGGGGAVRIGRRLYHFGGATRTAGVNDPVDQPDHWVLDLGPSEDPADDAGAWLPLAAMPNPANHMGSGSVGGVAYAIGGQHGADEASGNQPSLRAYDPDADVWTAAADMPRGLGHVSASVVSANGRLVVLGGVANGGKVDDVIEYDPETDTWLALTPLPGVRQSPVAGFIGDEVIVNGGVNGGIRTTTWAGSLPGTWEGAAGLPVALGEVAGGIIDGVLYLVGEGDGATLAHDLATDTWSGATELAPRPLPGNHHAAEVIDGQLYLFGGLGGGSSGQVQVYDPVVDSWQTRTAAPFAAGSSSTAVIDGRVIFAGGIVGGATTDQVAIYDPVADSWSAAAPMPMGVNHAAAATDGERLFVFGGRTGGNVVSNGFDRVQIYDPDTDTWEASTDPGSLLAPLPQARGGTGRAVYFAGEFYVLGGETSTGAGATAQNVYDRVDVYDPTSNSWRAGSPMPTARHGIFPLLHAGRIYVAGGGVQAGNSQSTVYQVYNADTCGSSCPFETTLVFEGAALGGSLELEIEGVLLYVATAAGATLEEVADAVAEAIHADATLAGLDVTAQAVGGILTTNGAIPALSNTDPGLLVNADPPAGPIVAPPARALPALAGGAACLALVAALVAVAASALGRRGSGAPRRRVTHRA